MDPGGWCHGDFRGRLTLLFLIKSDIIFIYITGVSWIQAAGAMVILGVL